MSPTAQAAKHLSLRPVSRSALASHDEFETGGADRPYRVFVHRPDTPVPEGGYPVIFLLDGNVFFPLAVAIMRASFFPAEQAIVVGIGHEGPGPFDPRRMYDCTVPVTRSELPAFAGADPAAFGGAAAYRTLIEAVAAQVSALYPTGGHRALIGYSVAGLHVLDTLLASPASFDTYAAISPALWWKNSYLVDEARKSKSVSCLPECRVLLSAGEIELDLGDARHQQLFLRMYRAMPAAFAGMTFEQAASGMTLALSHQRCAENIDELSSALRSAGFDTDFSSFPDEDHHSVVPAALGKAIRQILLSRTSM